MTTWYAVASSIAPKHACKATSVNTKSSKQRSTTSSAGRSGHLEDRFRRPTAHRNPFAQIRESFPALLKAKFLKKSAGSRRPIFWCSRIIDEQSALLLPANSASNQISSVTRILEGLLAASTSSPSSPSVTAGACPWTKIAKTTSFAHLCRAPGASMRRTTSNCSSSSSRDVTAARCGAKSSKLHLLAFGVQATCASKA